MAEKNVISIGKMDEIIKDYFPEYEAVDWRGEELTVRKFLPYSLVAEIVSKVTDACFDEHGEYHPEVKEFAIRLCYLEAATNVRIPENVEKQYLFLFGSDLWEAVLSGVNLDQYNYVLDAIDEKIEVRNDANRAAFEREVNTVIESLNQIGEQAKTLFENIAPEDLQAMISAIGENGVDEEKLAQAVVRTQNEIREEKAAGGETNNVVPFPATDGEQDGE